MREKVVGPHTTHVCTVGVRQKRLGRPHEVYGGLVSDNKRYKLIELSSTCETVFADTARAKLQLPEDAVLFFSGDLWVSENNADGVQNLVGMWFETPQQ